MKTIGIIGAMNLEIKLLKDNMNIIKEESLAGFNYYIGKMEGIKVILTCCSIGKVNAAVCTQILIDRFKVDYVINTGIAGSLHKEVQICDVVISTDVTYHDVRKDQMKRCFPYKEYFDASKELIKVATKACELIKTEEWNYHLGRIVSGECFVSDNKLKQKIIEGYSPYCVEMEGTAIGHVAYINSIPFVVIRSISDNADDEATISCEAFEEISAKQSANIVINMVKMI